MKRQQSNRDHRKMRVEKKRLDLDMAYCDVTYDSKEGRYRCYAKAHEDAKKRGDL